MKSESNIFLHSQPSEKKGFTLLEVLIGMFIFTLMSGGVISGMIQSLKISDRSIARSTAHSIAVSYGEQIMAQDYESLLEALSNNSYLSLYSVPLTAIEEITDIEEQFKFGEVFLKDVIMDIHPEDTTIPTKLMNMKFTITAEDLNTGTDPVIALAIKISYSFLPSALNENDESHWIHDEVHIVKSSSDIL